MDAFGEIEIRIEGTVGTRKLVPGLVDTDEIREILAEGSYCENDSGYSDAYLDELATKAAPAWRDVPDPEAWLEWIRGAAAIPPSLFIPLQISPGTP